MRLIFGAANTPGSWLIRLFTFSRYSHVGIVYGDEVIEAHFPRVRSISLGEFKTHYPKWETAKLPCKDEYLAEQWLRTRIGNLYDLGGLIGIVFQREWQSNNRDFCSEMPILAARHGGTDYVRSDSVHRVTPELLREISIKD